MKNLLLLVVSLPLAACVVDVADSGDGSGSDSGSGSGSGSGSNDSGGISGSITQSATWSGTVTFKGPATIESGVTITVSPGATLAFGGSSGLTVKGTLDVQGTSAQKVNIQPATGTFFGGISNSGTVKLTYVVQKGGGISTNAGSSTTVTDTQLSAVVGDFLVMNGGSLTMTYSQIGVPNDTTHCQMHFNSADSVSITHSNIVGADYGFMFYGGANGVYTENNWFGNGIHVERQGNASGTFSNGWFDRGAPSGAGITLNNPAAAKLTNAGVRP